MSVRPSPVERAQHVTDRRLPSIHSVVGDYIPEPRQANLVQLPPIRQSLTERPLPLNTLQQRVGSAGRLPSISHSMSEGTQVSWSSLSTSSTHESRSPSIASGSRDVSGTYRPRSQFFSASEGPPEGERRGSLNHVYPVRQSVGCAPYRVSSASMQQSPAPSPGSSTHSYQDPQAQLPADNSISPMPWNLPPSAPQEKTQNPLKYTLVVRQNPSAARACGFGERDRRVVDPPPVVELRIIDQVTGELIESGLETLLVLHCALFSSDGLEDLSGAVGPAGRTRSLIGDVSSSSHEALDEFGAPGTFFIFPNLSCRSPGRFRLYFTLTALNMTQLTIGSRHHSVASAMSDVFTSYKPKEFPGMGMSSRLLKALRRQGVNVGVERSWEVRRGRRVPDGRKRTDSTVHIPSSEEDRMSTDEDA